MGLDNNPAVKWDLNQVYALIKREKCVFTDDGSGLTRCWAKDDVAANFLNLPIHIDQSLENIISSEAMINARHLNLLLKKYGMIMLHSLGHAHDITNDRIMFYDGKDRTLDFEEQKFLYALIRKACHGVCLVSFSTPIFFNRSPNGTL